ncbi:MAG: hypothetical protein ACRDD1_04970, partial [Planctomycetia bacterium]
MAVQAQSLRPGLQWNDKDTPERVLADIQRARTRGTNVASSQNVVATAGSDEAVRLKALNMLHQAREAAKAGRVDQSQQLCEQARSLGAKYRPFDDTPDKVAAVVKQLNSPTVAAPTAPAGKIGSSDADPRVKAQAMLAQAEAMVQAGKTTEAETVLAQVEAMKISFGAFDKHPAQIRAAIAARQPTPTKPTTVAAAPTTPSVGRSTGPARGRSDAAPKMPAGMAVPPSVAGVGPAVPSKATVNVRKAEAVKAVAQARAAFDKGDYRTAVELAQSAKAMNESFGPNEDSPEAVLKAHEAVRSRLQERASQTAAAKAPEARKPMVETRVPMDKGAAEATVVAAPKPIMPTIPVIPPAPEPSAVKLTSTAPEPSAKGPQLFEAGMNAFRRKEYAQAGAYFSEADKYRATLSPVQQQSLQEHLAFTQGMQNELLPASAQRLSVPGRSRAGDGALAMQEKAPAPGGEAAPGGAGKAAAGDRSLNEDVIGRAKQAELVEQQRLRREVIETLEQANRLVQTDPENAIRQLENQLATVQDSPLDRDLTAPLVRQLQQRIRQYQVDRKQVELAQLERDRQQAVVDARRRQDQAVVQQQTTLKELMTRFNSLMDAGNYIEAEAVAYQMTEIDPDEVSAHAALHKATLSKHYSAIEDIENRKKEAYWETLYQVEKSAIPFPDEPPL